MVVKREIECQLPVMGPFYEMIANVYAQGWVELLLTRFQWIFFFADALDSLFLASLVKVHVGTSKIWSWQTVLPKGKNYGRVVFLLVVLVTVLTYMLSRMYK